MIVEPMFPGVLNILLPFVVYFFVAVLLSAHVKRVSVSRMQDFLLQTSVSSNGQNPHGMKSMYILRAICMQ